MSNRRDFLKTLGAATLVGAIPGMTLKTAAAATPFKIAVVGGGFGGASVARYLKLWGGAAVEVTLFDSVATYKTPILSNLVLNGQKTMNNLSFSLANAANRGGFRFVQGQVDGFESGGADYQGRLLVRKPSGVGYYSDAEIAALTAPIAAPASRYFHKLVVAPGIDFDSSGLPSLTLANGNSPDLTLPIPHAWKSGDQVLNLKKQLDGPGMANGAGVFVLAIPRAPYRCPPGPYERACIVADYLKRTKGGGKVVVLDANPPTVAGDPYSAIQSEPATFRAAFVNRYPGIVEYRSGVTLLSVSALGGQLDPKTVEFLPLDSPISELKTCQVLNVIPPARAGSVAYSMGLLPSGSRFVDVDLSTYAAAANPHIHVIGDAHNSTQPKAGHIANSEAKVCADALLRSLGVIATPALPPVTNSACYSPISKAEASWTMAGYRYSADPALLPHQRMQRIPESFAEADKVTSDHYKMMLAWYNNLVADVGYTA